MNRIIKSILVLSMVFGLSACVEEKAPVRFPVMGIELNPRTVKLSVGDTKQIDAEVKPSGVKHDKVEWGIWVEPSKEETTEPAPEIVSVDQDGNVTALAAGKATIYARVENITALCEVTAVPVLAESIVLNKTEVKIGEGEEIDLDATVTPDNVTDKTIVWTSSDEKVATVNEHGHVVALKSGSVTITASCGEVSAKCSVQVLGQDPSLNHASMILKKKESKELTLTLPSRLESKAGEVTWSSENASIVTAVPTDGNRLVAVITGIGVGTAKVKAQIPGEPALECSVEVRPLKEDVTGKLAELDLDQHENTEEFTAALARLDGKGVTEYVLFGNFKKLGKIDKSTNPFLSAPHVEKIDFTHIKATSWPDVAMVKGPEVKGVPNAMFTRGTLTNQVDQYSHLKEVILPADVKGLGKYAFCRQENNFKLVAPGLEHINEGALNYTVLGELHLTTAEETEIKQYGKGGFAGANAEACILYLHANKANADTAKNQYFGLQFKQVICK